MISIFNGRLRNLQESHSTSFIQIEHRILKHMKHFTSAEWMVFCAISLHADANGVCFPSIPRLVETTGLSAPTVRNALSGLESKVIDGYKVMQRTARFSDKRQTSNEYVIFPGSPSVEGERNLQGEGKVFYRGEGKEICTPINKNQLEQESINNIPSVPEVVVPKVATKKRSKVSLPKDDDPARELYIAFRQWRYPDQDATDFNVTEWKSVYFILYQMVNKSVSPETLVNACKNLTLKWGNVQMVSINSLWKHWSTATQLSAPIGTPIAKATTKDHATSAVDVMKFVREMS
jgi:hypothetical protein